MKRYSLIDVLVRYRNWTFTHEWWFPVSGISIGVTILLCLILSEIWPVIAGVGTAVFLIMCAVPLGVEYFMDENDQPSETVSKLLTWGNVIAIFVGLIFINVFIALTINPSHIGWVLFCAIYLAAGIFVLWIDHIYQIKWDEKKKDKKQ